MVPSRLGGELFTGLLPSVPSVVKFEGAERILSLRPFSIEILSFHYWRAPRGPRGVKWSPIDQYTCHWRFDVLRLTPNWINYKKIPKKCPKCLFSEVFSNSIYLGSILILFQPIIPIGGFKSEDTGKFLHLQHQYFKSLSLAENLTKFLTVLVQEIQILCSG